MESDPRTNWAYLIDRLLPQLIRRHISIMIMIDATPMWNVLQHCQMLVNVTNDCFYRLQRNDLTDSLLHQYRAHITYVLVLCKK